MSSATHYGHHQQAALGGRISSDKVEKSGIPAPGQISCRAVRHSLITLSSGQCCFRTALAKTLCLNLTLLGCIAYEAHVLVLGETAHSHCCLSTGDSSCPHESQRLLALLLVVTRKAVTQ